MRLINSHSLELEEFVDAPPYAILSHTWGEEEVTFQQYRNWHGALSRYLAEGEGLSRDQGITPADIALFDRIKHGQSLMTCENPQQQQQQGILKILRCVERARSERHDHVWVDTCCIDKTSSAELQEAINSMFAWYEDADICYAYLSDIDKRIHGHDDLSKSRWFSRGWTLQELLAPANVLFLDTNWVTLGSKSRLSRILEKTTGIDYAYLTHGANPREASIATRMSWAANRETTRQEDKAYCLLGIFDIHMPMLYGEGNRAFQRLQMEIMKTSGDSSIMAWDYSGTWMPASCSKLDFDLNLQHRGEHLGLLATSPLQYTKCQSIVKPRTNSYDTAISFSMSQHGLEIEAHVSIDPVQPRIFYLALGCQLTDGSDTYYNLVLPLMAVTDQVNIGSGILATRGRWMVPMAVRQGLTHPWQIAKIRIVPGGRLDFKDKLSLQFNCHLIGPEWSLVGMYPPGPDVLCIDTKDPDDPRTFHFVEPLHECPCDVNLPTRRRVFCWKRKSDGMRIIIILNIAQAELAKCIHVPHGEPRNSWCWMAKMDRPFNLEIAQLLLTDTRYLNGLPLFHLRDSNGEVIPYHELFSYFEKETRIPKRTDRNNIAPTPRIWPIRTITDVNKLL
ncbi:hypothetical protein G7054_g7211 [Neopestalotiopsis clavispora]|nr:hypothetical protein G7054_g7211 [Neopestalotiopsis clavispora]